METSPVNDSQKDEPLDLTRPGTWKVIFGTVLAGPMLLALGISQAVYGWAGDSLFMRISYATVCILMGILFLWFASVLIPTVVAELDMEENPVHTTEEDGEHAGQDLM